jgi:dTDP-4-dehydrorhamnose reductase
LTSIGKLTATDRSQIDLARPDSVRESVQALKPAVIVNAAAYTAVDLAEKEPHAAIAVNFQGVAVLAEEALRCGALLVHFSSDYVFDGEKTSAYVEEDPPSPLNTYGRSKLAGERSIQASGCRHLIFRTSWVYSESGSNFLLTMLRLAREKNALRVVDDQHGAPTTSHMLADAAASAISQVVDDSSKTGLYHMTAGGATTWCRFAREIFRAKNLPVSVSGISTAEYPAPAPRPRNSVLDNSKLGNRLGIQLPQWEFGMHDVLTRL